MMTTDFILCDTGIGLVAVFIVFVECAILCILLLQFERDTSSVNYASWFFILCSNNTDICVILCGIFCC